MKPLPSLVLLALVVLLGCDASAQPQDTVLVPGDLTPLRSQESAGRDPAPPLAQEIVDKHMQFVEWVLDIKLNDRGAPNNSSNWSGTGGRGWMSRGGGLSSKARRTILRTCSLSPVKTIDATIIYTIIFSNNDFWRLSATKTTPSPWTGGYSQATKLYTNLGRRPIPFWCQGTHP